MSIRLLIVVNDQDYTSFLCDVLAERYADTLDVRVCTDQQKLTDLLTANDADAVLADPALLSGMEPLDRSAVWMLLQEDGKTDPSAYPGVPRIQKYQRISQIASGVMETYAQEEEARKARAAAKAKIVATWSPAGGTGKTTVALAYAARCVSEGQKATYLNFEEIDGSAAFLPQTGAGFREVFLSPEYNLTEQLERLSLEDSDTGIRYLSMSECCGDITSLSGEAVEDMVNAVAEGTNVVVADCGSTLDACTKQLLTMADKVLVVLNQSAVALAKWKQFAAQGNLFPQIQEKVWLVCNQGLMTDSDGLAGQVKLPPIFAGDPIAVVKALAANISAAAL